MSNGEEAGAMEWGKDDMDFGGDFLEDMRGLEGLLASFLIEELVDGVEVGDIAEESEFRSNFMGYRFDLSLGSNFKDLLDNERIIGREDLSAGFGIDLNSLVMWGVMACGDHDTGDRMEV